MPPHCDSLDGPVVAAAREALDTGDVTRVLPYVPADAEDELRRLFDDVLPVVGLGPAAAEVAQRLFFETTVRLHRAGEGAAYTGLKPAGLSVGPVIPLAEAALRDGSPSGVEELLTRTVHEQLKHRLDEVAALATRRDDSLEDARRHVSASLGFQVYCHHLYQAMHASAHGQGHGHAE